MATKKASKGKRYSANEKAKIVAFVHAVNSEKGRGGATAATKKFGVSGLTVSSWMKGEAMGKGNATGASKGGSNKILVQLTELDRKIAEKRKELAALEQKFENLKEKL